MFMGFVSNQYRDKLCNSGKQQVCMQRFFVLGFTPCDTKAVLEVVNGFFHIYPDFVGTVPFLRAANGSRICPEVLLWINVNHSSAGGRSTGSFTVADTSALACVFIVFPFHFWPYKLHGGDTTAQMGFAALPLHRK